MSDSQRSDARSTPPSGWGLWFGRRAADQRSDCAEEPTPLKEYIDGTGNDSSPSNVACTDSIRYTSSPRGRLASGVMQYSEREPSIRIGSSCCRKTLTIGVQPSRIESPEMT